MSRVVIDLHALRHNLATIHQLMTRQGANWSVVTKSLCGHMDTLRALRAMGVRSVSDSRLDNLEAVHQACPDVERWYLRPPAPSAVTDVVRLAQVSLNSEIGVIEALAEEAARKGTCHGVVIMVELGDLREGILPGGLVSFYERVFNLPSIEVVGLGGQIGCLAGAVPSVDQIAQLLLYRELLELKFQHKLRLVSAGSSVFLGMVLEGQLPRGVNHFRIGEALFLGTDLVTGGWLPGLRNDVVRIEGEVSEVKEKSLVPLGETGTATPFEATEQEEEEAPQPGQRGYRALVTLGQLDTDVSGLTPLEDAFQVAGASSDITVVNVGEYPGRIRVGDTLSFRPSYGAFVRIMADPYIPKEVEPPLGQFVDSLDEQLTVDVAPCWPEGPDLGGTP